MGRLEQQAYQGLDGKRYFLINEMTHAMNLEAGLDISPMQLRGWVKRGQIKAPRRGEVDGKRYSQRSDWRLFEATRENVVQATLAVSQLRERKPHVPKNHVRRKVLAMALGITPNALIYYEDLGMLTPIRTAAGICYSSEEVRALKEYRNGFRDQR